MTPEQYHPDPDERDTRGRAALAAGRATPFGFLTAPQLEAIALASATEHTPTIVRCGALRFVAPAYSAYALIAILTREGSEYVRDVALYDGGTARAGRAR